MVIVTDQAFDELLDRVEAIAIHPRVDDGVDPGEGDEDPLTSPRHQFVTAVDRAVKRIVAQRDRQRWYTQTSRRFGCRLHFFCVGHYVYLVACLPRDRESGNAAGEVETELDDDYST